MISEAVGKILGMALAYAVSALGLFLAYWNYRRRIVRADRVMTPTAWLVLAAVVASVIGGTLVVASLAEPPALDAAETVAEALEAEAVGEAPAPAEPAPETGEEEKERWPLIGILLPAAIFLVATWITAALYRHFTHTGH